MHLSKKIKKKASRKLSFTERGHIVFDEIFSTCYCQLIIEGEGEIDLNQLESAIKKSSDSNPGSRLVLRGYLNFSRLVDSGTPPPVRVIDNHSWDGLSSDNAWFLGKTLSPRKGPTCEVLVLKGSPGTIIFRTHHMVMDGRGILLWAEDVFRILRGENPVSCFSKLTELEFTRSINKDYRKPFPRDNIAPTGKADSTTSLNARWIRKRVHGRYSNLVGQISVILAEEARKYSPGNVWISVPVDLRYRKKDFLTTTNFASLIYTEVKPESSAKQISEDIKYQLKNSQDLKFDRQDVLCRYFPIAALRKMLVSRMLKRHSSGFYGSSAQISNLGMIDLDKFEGGGFHPLTIFGYPQGGYFPAFIVLTGSNNAVEIGISTPVVLASDGRLEKLMDRIVSGIVPN